MYDAREKLQPKSDMAKLPSSDIRIHDIVLMELLVRRVRSGNESGNYNWVRWQAQHELLAVHLLHSAPPCTSFCFQ